MCVFVCMCSGMHVFLRGCLTDLVSKSEVGQNVDQSRMEQTGDEWLSNHPNPFLLLFFPPTILLLHAPAVLLLWASQEVFDGGVFGVEAG